jgi:release factor glutamine methyltransferase
MKIVDALAEGAVYALPRFEAELLLAFVCACPRSVLHAWPERVLTADQISGYRAALVARHRGMPMAYLLGKKEFFSLDFTVTPDTLIPRPETELLVEYLLIRWDQTTALSFADLGTGAGIIGISLLVHRRQWRGVLVDVSYGALSTARVNAVRHGLLDAANRVSLRRGDWCQALVPGELFDFIVSNPPYIASDDPCLGEGDLRFEPRNALSAGVSGTDALDIVLHTAHGFLKPGGYLVLEHGATQQDWLCRRVEKSLTFWTIEALLRDWAGQPRVCILRYN